MIGFQINNEFLDLPENPTVELNRNSPIFQQDGFVVEDYTLPITFPNTPRNSRILGWPHIVENSDRLRPKWTCILWYNGIPRLKGELRAKSPINSRSISANFVRGISQIGEDLKEKSLRDIIDETVTIHELSITKSVRLNFVPATSERCAIIINGTSFEGTDMADLVSSINADEELTATASNESNELLITNDTPGEFEPFYVEIPDGSIYVMLSPTPPWLVSYKEAYEDFASGYVGTNRLLQPIRFGTFANFYQSDDEFPLKSYPVVNFYGPDGFAANRIEADTYNYPQTINVNSMSPMVTLSYVLEKIEEAYGISINFPALNVDDIFFHSFTLDRPIRLLGSKKIILFERTFNINQLVPDIKINDFLKALQVGSNSQMAFDPDSRILSITNREPIVEARKYIDITDQCSPPSDVQLSTQRGLKFFLVKDAGDTIDTATDYPDDYIIGDGEREIKVEFGTPAMKDHSMQNYWPGYFGFSTISQYTAAINQAFETDFSFRLARYMEGLFQVPYIDSRPFFWFGDDGLFNLFWKSTSAVENNPVSMTSRWLMTREQAFNLDWNTKLRIDRSDFLIRSFNVSLQNNGLSMAECEWIRVAAFKEEVPPVPPNLTWIGVESSLVCLKDGENLNTGMATYQYIAEFNADLLKVTGKVKVNDPTDPDYIAPAENLALCPLHNAEFQPGNLYISSDPVITDPGTKVRINNVEYTLPDAPYPYVMTDQTAVAVVLSNPGQDILKFTVKAFIGGTEVKSLSVTIYPGNWVDTPFGQRSTSELYRRLIFTSSMGDFNSLEYNRLEIITETI